MLDVVPIEPILLGGWSPDSLGCGLLRLLLAGLPSLRERSIPERASLALPDLLSQVRASALSSQGPSS